MFKVNWEAPKRKPHVLHFVSCPPNRYVLMLAAPEDLPVIALHWLQDGKGSAPCQGEGCPLIGLTRHFKSAYAPVLQFAQREGRWMPAILGIGDPGHTLALTDFKGEIITVGKNPKGHEDKRLIYLGTPTIKLPPPPHIAQSFDVRPHLLRRWGLFKEADLLGCEFHLPQETLPFPAEEAS